MTDFTCGDFVVLQSGLQSCVVLFIEKTDDDDSLAVVEWADGHAGIRALDMIARSATDAEKIQWCDERISVGQKLTSDGIRRKEHIGDIN